MEDLIQTVCAILRTTPARWERLAELPVDLFNRAPAEGEWSARACLQHLLDTEVLGFSVRTRAIVEGRDFAAIDPDTLPPTLSPSVTSAELAAAFASARMASLELIDTLSPADLDRTARHSELGIVTLGQLLNEWAAHDLMHTVQAERALMQPFIAGCGPWQPYFADHRVRR